MGQVLYRKYRSKSLDEIVGQDHITQSLKQALKSGRISHAYLFTGPRGVGKTSVARILAHEINGIPYTDDSAHLDIIEIDAASNRRIDEIRDLRDKVYIAPTTAKYKVYIIDEVHMLTREAFNALLKTLEEPPAHVVFILATTDAHKIPETIVSRTQRYTFKPVKQQAVIDHLAEIAKTEGIKVSPEALKLLAQHGEGSFRDSISLLDQASDHEKKLELEDVQRMLGIPAEDSLRQLTAAIDAYQPTETVSQLANLYEQGFQAGTIASELSRVIRLRVLHNPADGAAMQLLSELLSVPTAYAPERYLEVCLLRASIDQAATSVPTKMAKDSTQKEVLEAMPAKKPTAATNNSQAPEPPQIETAQLASEHIAKQADEPAKPVSKSKKTQQPLDETVWPDLLAALKQKYNTLYGVVRMAQPVFNEDGLTLKFGFSFHQKRVTEAKNQHILAETLKDLTGQDVAITCVVEKGIDPPTLQVKEMVVQAGPAVKSDISSISNIFGGAELLES